MIDIKRLKAELGLTQAELGAIMGLRQPQVSTILLGKGKLREEHILKLQQALGDKINIYLNENTGETQKDNTITNSTKTQEMDPLTMDYINTLKEQLAKVTAVVEEQNAIIKHLTQKGDDEVLSRRVGAIKEGQDELTENL
jgi:plasmid maintenance system antidote protein VapI